MHGEHILSHDAGCMITIVRRDEQRMLGILYFTGRDFV